MAWLSVLFTIPGAVLVVLDLLYYSQSNIVFGHRPDDALRLFILTMYLLPFHYLLLIPMWFLLRASGSHSHMLRIKVFSDLLTVTVTAPVLHGLLKNVGYGRWGSLAGGYFTFIIVGTIIVAATTMGWVVILRRR